MAGYPLPRVENDVRVFGVPTFASLDPMQNADLTEFLYDDPQLPKWIIDNYRKLRALTEDPIGYARQEIVAGWKAKGKEVDPKDVSDKDIGRWLDTCDEPKLPRVDRVFRALDFSVVAANGGTSVNGGNQNFVINGGLNAVVLDCRAVATLADNSGSANLDFIKYQDVDTQKFTWCDSTPLFNVTGSGREPGLIWPQKWYGRLYHNITITNNWTAIVNVNLIYDIAIVYHVGA